MSLSENDKTWIKDAFADTLKTHHCPVGLRPSGARCANFVARWSSVAFGSAIVVAVGGFMAWIGAKLFGG